MIIIIITIIYLSKALPDLHGLDNIFLRIISGY